MWAAKSSKSARKVNAALAAAVRKPRVQHGLLSSLSEAEQYQLFVWLTQGGMTYRAVSERVKHDFGVRSTLATLRQFRRNYGAGRMRPPDPVEIRIEIIGNGKIVVARGGAK